ncbi:MAG: DUF6691 family protein [Caldilineaceae bacterium]
MIQENSFAGKIQKAQSNASNTAFLRDVLPMLSVLIIGIGFGIVLVKAEVIGWFQVQQMFRFEAAHMYLVIMSAIGVGALSLFVVKRLQLRTLQNEAIKIKEKPFQKGVIYGGLLFGMGWAITGACPGPIYAQLGSGEYLALIPFVGALLGSYFYAYVRTYLPH